MRWWPAVLAMGGCSLSVMANRQPEGVRPECTADRTMPAADAIGSALAIAGGVALVHDSDEAEAQDADEVVAEAIEDTVEASVGRTLMIVGIGYGVAALWGLAKVDACRKALQGWVPPPIDPNAWDDPPRIYCTTSPVQPAVGACSRTAAGCEARRAALQAGGVPPGPCAIDDDTSCVFATRIDDGVAVESCAPSAVACAELRAGLIERPERFGDVSPCAAPEAR